MPILSVLLLIVCLEVTEIGKSVSWAEEVEKISIEDVEDVSESASFFNPENFPRVERAFNLLMANPMRKKTLLFTVDHRNREAVDDEPFHNFLGFDSGGLKVGLGLRYGILDSLDAGLFRVNGTAEVFDEYDFDLRVLVLNQRDHRVDLAIRPGFTWFSQEKGNDASGGFCQLLASRSFLGRFTIGTGVLYHSDSSNDMKSNVDDDYSVAVQGIMEARLLPWLALDFEMTSNVGGYRSTYPQLRSGVKILTARHSFSIVLSNTQYMSAGGVVSNANRDFGDLVLGFSITREWRW